MNQITRDDLRALLDAGSVTLVEALPADPAGTVVVYCADPACSRSTVTAAAFERFGYTDVRVYPGGKADWLASGLPLEGTGTGVAAR
jgi:3-mercaptopyruvate sulfurtransferase SseA